MDKVIFAIVILLLILIVLLCRWGKCVNELPSDLNSKDRYADTAKLDEILIKNKHNKPCQ